MFPLLFRVFRKEAVRAVSLAFLLLPSVAASALPVSLTDDGAAFDAGPGGPLTLWYPKLTTDKGEEVHRIEAKNVGGKSATITYEGGAKLELAVAGNGEVTLRFSDLPHDVAQWKMDSILPLAFAQGGKWKIGTATQPFPASLGAKPHLFQGAATDCEVTTATGTKITWTLPPYTFLEVIDNRAWQWAAFDVALHVPVDGDHKEFRVRLAVAGK